jgi:tRNA threonylcarbamoyladenosine biosynthesis protein TsaE
MIGQGLSVGDIVLLIGDLGSGKTCMTQGLIKGLGSEDIARSPTFVIVAQYTAICPVYHMDLYRIDGIHDMDAMQLDEYLYGDGVCLVEWADKHQNLFPKTSLLIEFSKTGDNMRELKLSSSNSDHEGIFSNIGNSRNIDR